MTTLNQAVNGELLKGQVKLSEIERVSDFFKSDIGNHYTLQLTGNGDEDYEYDCDEYGLHDEQGKTMGYVNGSQIVEYTVDCAKNITKVLICGMWLHPYKSVPVALQFATV